MKTTALRKFIIAGSLAVSAIAGAAPFDHATQFQAPGLKPTLELCEKAPEIRQPAAPVEILPYRPIRPIRPRPNEVFGGKIVPCILDHPEQDRLAVTGTDEGCIKKPTKPIRPKHVA